MTTTTKIGDFVTIERTAQLRPSPWIAAMDATNSPGN